MCRPWKAAHPDGNIIYRDFSQSAQVCDSLWIGAAYTPPGDRTVEQTESLAPSNELISELEGADEYEVGVAMHNFSIPSVVKLWIDQIVRNGRTCTYGEEAKLRERF